MTKLHLPIAALLLVSLTACQLPKVEFKRPDPLPQDAVIRVYMNHNQAKGADYTDPYRNIARRGDNLERVIIEAIEQAESRIDVAVQEFRLPRIAEALAAKQEAGVQVRVIVENDYNRSWGGLSVSEVGELDRRDRTRYQEFVQLADQDNNGQLSPQEAEDNDALLILKNAGIPVLDDTADGSKGSGLMHHKFMVVDNFTIITGSANWTLSGIHGDLDTPESRGNANNLLHLQNVALAEIFTAEFNQMWGDGVGKQPDSRFGVQKKYRSPQRVMVGETPVTVQFSPTSETQPWPQSSNGLIAARLQQAQSAVNLALFVFSDQRIVNTLQSRHQQGVTVQALIDRSFAFRNYSEGLDMLGVALPQNCQYEKNNQPWTNSITTVGIPQLAEGDKLHHKFGVMDGQTVITGSHNWSAAANKTNDETVLILENPVVAAHYEREFQRLYQTASLGVPEYIEERIREKMEQCPGL
ncbi:phospholipase D-like domain-containing protein [Spirulina sp. CS-785/01]|uniref:phospholipase D-like domain-containing protein n=1 Tax=Spirulina sp. CS-785/01 TaxID=3021716 RepID=UPI00232CBC9A|nr:phospholipase D-like domain-containing protein [Spirulina sp. CS-785/01]MDB9312141.1 phospholipase D-like domain-containing protein [Spirulina sp. CS-785/01]